MTRDQQHQQRLINSTVRIKAEAEEKKSSMPLLLCCSQAYTRPGGSQSSNINTIILDPLLRMIDTALSNYYEAVSCLMIRSSFCAVLCGEVVNVRLRNISNSTEPREK
jgi:hypothetical protein